jgi:hypothetical protein
MIGDLEGDLAENYAPSVVVLTADEFMSGHDGLRRLARMLRTYDLTASYKYGQILIAGELAMLSWRLSGPNILPHDGADTFLVRDGHIWTQTSHYVIRDLERPPPQPTGSIRLGRVVRRGR